MNSHGRGNHLNSQKKQLCSAPNQFFLNVAQHPFSNRMPTRLWWSHFAFRNRSIGERSSFCKGQQLQINNEFLEVSFPIIFSWKNQIITCCCGWFSSTEKTKSAMLQTGIEAMPCPCLCQSRLVIYQADGFLVVAVVEIWRCRICRWNHHNLNWIINRLYFSFQLASTDMVGGPHFLVLIRRHPMQHNRTSRTQGRQMGLTERFPNWRKWRRKKVPRKEVESL